MELMTIAYYKTNRVFTVFVLNKTVLNDRISRPVRIVRCEKIVFSIVVFVIIGRFANRLERLGNRRSMICCHAGLILASVPSEKSVFLTET